MTPASAKTRFFGRKRELARLATVPSGIVTLWGPPGIGKTRLALEASTAWALAHAGEKWFCDLGAARDAAGVCEAVRRTLDGESASARRAWIGAALAAREPGVFVLDGFENVAAHAVETVGAWAAAAPHVLFLVTSRVRLRAFAELALEVQALDEAVALFRDRAGERDLDEDAVADLASRLDGNPLAIELAAARLDMLSPPELARRLVHPLDILGDGEGTLRRAIDSSVKLLSAEARRALMLCAVLRGGFSVEDAEAVLDEGARVLEELQALRDASLLRCERGEDGVRFVLFDAVRDHALALLEASGDADDVRRRHARHFLDAARAGAGDPNVEDAAAFVLRADVDAARLAEVLGVLAARDACAAPETSARMLARAIELGGRLGLAASLLARAEHALGRALQMQGKLREASDALGRAADLAGDDHALRAEVSTAIGLVHHQLRELDRARTCYEHALADLGDDGSACARARCIGNLGAVHHDARRYDEALEHYHRALAVLRAAHEPRLEGIFLANLAVLHHERGASARARANFELALERLATTTDRRFEAITRTNLGMLLHETGAVAEARAEHERALEALRRIVDPRSEALCLGRLAMANAALGEHARAEKDLRRAKRILGGLEDAVAGAILALFGTFVDLSLGASEVLVREHLAEAHAPAWHGGASILDLSDDARSAARLIEAALARRGAARAAVLVVGPEAAWFRPPDGDAHELGNRRLLRRLLLRLVVQHRDAPGEGLSLEALRAAGWPDDRTRGDAAMNRIHVALTELRRRGLRTCLVRRDAHYLIDPAVRIELSDG